jgi:hypothetical protein
MPQPIITGTLGPVQQAPEIRYDPQRGVVQLIRYESADPNGLYALANQYALLGFGYTHNAGGPKSSLVIEASGPLGGQEDKVTDTWQIVANELQKDIREHPTILAMEAAYPGTIGYVWRDVELAKQGEAPGSPAPAAGSKPASDYLFHLLLRGTTHYAVPQYVLRHTTNAAPTYDKNVADTNVNKIYTTAQLKQEISSTQLWAYPCPARLIAKSDAIPSPVAVSGYTWGWRKLPSTETTTAHSRIEITTEYWLEQWNTSLLYALAV